MKTTSRAKEYRLKNGTKYMIIEDIHYCDWGYWTWKHIIPRNGKLSRVITEARGYYYTITHMNGNNYESYKILRC